MMLSVVVLFRDEWKEIKRTNENSGILRTRFLTNSFPSPKRKNRMHRMNESNRMIFIFETGVCAQLTNKILSSHEYAFG
jgi:hypothetical protein